MNSPGIESSSPLISVILPVRNRRDLLIEALESVRNQSYRPLEVVIVDDGSTDTTLESARLWAQRHTNESFSVKVLSQPASNANVARNRGLAESRGPLVAFLDSDDLWHPDKLSRQVQLWQQQPELGAVYCGLQVVDMDRGETLKVARQRYPQGWIGTELLIRDVTAPTSTYLIPRHVLEITGAFDEHLLARQDWDLWIRIGQKFPIGCVEQPLVDYRRHEGPQTGSDPQREIDAYRRILEKTAAVRKDCPWSVRQRILAAYDRRMARVHSHRGISKLRALGYALRSIVRWPLEFDSYAALLGIFLPRRLRARLNRQWNRVFGTTRLGIRSH